MRAPALVILLCGWILLSQHRASDGSFWYRQETKPVSVDECRATLKKITTRPAVGLTKWLDVTMAQLEKEFGNAAVPTLGSWIACWPEGTRLGEPDS